MIILLKTQITPGHITFVVKNRKAETISNQFQPLNMII